MFCFTLQMKETCVCVCGLVLGGKQDQRYYPISPLLCSGLMCNAALWIQSLKLLNSALFPNRKIRPLKKNNNNVPTMRKPLKNKSQVLVVECSRCCGFVQYKGCMLIKGISVSLLIHRHPHISKIKCANCLQVTSLTSACAQLVSEWFWSCECVAYGQTDRCSQQKVYNLRAPLGPICCCVRVLPPSPSAQLILHWRGLSPSPSPPLSLPQLHPTP